MADYSRLTVVAEADITPSNGGRTITLGAAYSAVTNTQLHFILNKTQSELYYSLKEERTKCSISGGVITIDKSLPVTATTDKIHIELWMADSAGTTPVSGTVTETNSGSIKTAVELLDDSVKVLGTDTYVEGTSKAVVVGGVRRDADSTLVNTTNEFAPFQVDTQGRHKVVDQITSKRLVGQLTRPADTNNYTAGDAINSSVASPVAIQFTGAARYNGGGGYLNEVKVETNVVQLASCTIRLWLFNATPASIVGDNVAFVNNFANSAARMCYIDVVFDALLAGSDTVFGRAMPSVASGSGIVPYNYMCAAADTSIYMLVQTLSAVTTPATGGVFNFYLNTVQL